MTKSKFWALWFLFVLQEGRELPRGPARQRRGCGLLRSLVEAVALYRKPIPRGRLRVGSSGNSHENVRSGSTLGAMLVGHPT